MTSCGKGLPLTAFQYPSMAGGVVSLSNTDKSYSL